MKTALPLIALVATAVAMPAAEPEPGFCHWYGQPTCKRSPHPAFQKWYGQGTGKRSADPEPAFQKWYGQGTGKRSAAPDEVADYIDYLEAHFSE